MSRYERVAAEDADNSPIQQTHTAIPNSPPPSFRSYPSSRRTSRHDIRQSEEERDLDDAFDAPSDDDEADEDTRDRQRLVRSNDASSPTDTDAAAQSHDMPRPEQPRRTVTVLPTFVSASSSGRPAGNSYANDGVFANLAAKPHVGEELEEKPPTYEQAAADATPPYWETTVLSPYHMTGDPNDVFVDGLLVGSMFSFIWNALISMSFQIIGFLLTYLLHTTHAAKHGSRAGLGITLLQYGFQMRYSASLVPNDPVGGSPVDGIPDDPNSHDFNPSEVTSATASALSAMSTSDWLSYLLMIVGWFILIRALSDFMRARRQEALVRSSPDRGLGTAVIAENERPESSV